MYSSNSCLAYSYDVHFQVYYMHAQRIVHCACTHDIVHTYVPVPGDMHVVQKGQVNLGYDVWGDTLSGRMHGPPTTSIGQWN